MLQFPIIIAGVIIGGLGLYSATLEFSDVDIQKYSPKSGYVQGKFDNDYSFVGKVENKESVRGLYLGKTTQLTLYKNARKVAEYQEGKWYDEIDSSNDDTVFWKVADELNDL